MHWDLSTTVETHFVSAQYRITYNPGPSNPGPLAAGFQQAESIKEIRTSVRSKRPLRAAEHEVLLTSPSAQVSPSKAGGRERHD